MPLLALLLIVSVAPLHAAEHVVFLDTFDAPDGVNVNAAFEARQAGGEVASPYKKLGGEAGQSAIVSKELHRDGAGELETAANFAGRIAGKNFSLSVDARCLTNDGWGSISVLGGTAENRGLSPLSIRLHGAGGLVFVASGAAGETPPPTETRFTPAELSVLLGREFDITESHNYKYVVSDNGTRVAFFIDNVELPLRDNILMFDDVSALKISFVNVGNADSRLAFDNLTITAENP